MVLPRYDRSFHAWKSMHDDFVINKHFTEPWIKLSASEHRSDRSLPSHFICV
jgi:hypothetical protein